MSSLYQTPSEVSAEISRRTRTGNWFTDGFTDWISGGLSIGDDGQIEREGAAWWLQGITPGSETIAQGKKRLQESRVIDNLVQGSGLTDEELRKAAGGQKLTASNTKGIISKAVRDYETPEQKRTAKRQERADNRQDRLDREGIAARRDETRLGYAKLQADQQLNAANLKMNSDNNRTSLMAQDRRLAHTSKVEGMRQAHTASENAKERALTRDLSNSSNDLQMQMAFMDAELQDKRMEYDRETRRLDKRDRMIAQLMAGIGQLGGAFAI